MSLSINNENERKGISISSKFVDSVVQLYSFLNSCEGNCLAVFLQIVIYIYKINKKMCTKMYGYMKNISLHQL